MIRRVAFSAVGGAGWLGGQNYLRNLVAVVRHHGAGNIEPVVFAGTSDDGDSLSQFCRRSGIECVVTSDFDPARLRRRALPTVATGHDGISEQHFAAAKIDAVFEAGSYFGWRPRLPIVSWYPDFQHRHLPAMFRSSDRLQRDLLLHLRMAGPRIFMLSSRSAEADCLRFFPASAGRTIAVPFAVQPPPLAEHPAGAVLARYGITGTYVFMPNQFWRHKNHGVVIEALQQLQATGRSVRVVSTGLQQDLRDPAHFPSIVSQIAGAELGDAFCMLGVVPYADLMVLLGSAAALLNPSLFEGWSTSVEEAKCLGVPLLLSDIDVHREQSGADAAYFSAHDAAALATILADYPADLPFPDDARRRAGARPLQEIRLKAFADGFAESVDRAIRYRSGR